MKERKTTLTKLNETLKVVQNDFKRARECGTEGKLYSLFQYNGHKNV